MQIGPGIWKDLLHLAIDTRLYLKQGMIGNGMNNDNQSQLRNMETGPSAQPAQADSGAY